MIGSNRTPYDRRNVLALLAGVTAAASFSWSSGVVEGHPPELRELLRRLAVALSRDDEMCKVGDCFLKTRPAERNHIFLTNQLVEDLSAPNVLTELHTADSCSNCLPDMNSVMSRISQKVEQDFARKNMVDIDGWRLSETEARLCALACVIPA